MPGSLATASGGSVREPGIDRGVLASLSRHDLVLLAIPAAFVVALLAAALLGVSLERALAGAATVGVATLVDALFVNPPPGGDAST